MTPDTGTAQGAPDIPRACLLCDTKAREGARFCTNCGARVDAEWLAREIEIARELAPVFGIDPNDPNVYGLVRSAAAEAKAVYDKVVSITGTNRPREMRARLKKMFAQAAQVPRLKRELAQLQVLGALDPWDAWRTLEVLADMVAEPDQPLPPKVCEMVGTSDRDEVHRGLRELAAKARLRAEREDRRAPFLAMQIRRDIDRQRRQAERRGAGTHRRAPSRQPRRRRSPARHVARLAAVASAGDGPPPPDEPPAPTRPREHAAARGGAS